MRRVFLLIVMLNLKIQVAQQYVRVHYTVEIDKKIQEKNNEKLRKFFHKMSYTAIEKNKRIFEIAKNLDFILEFTPKESIYYVDDYIKQDEIPSGIYLRAQIKGRAIGKIYVNNNEKKMYHQHLDLINNKTVIETSLLKDEHWKITNERDTIMGYPVIKATKGKAVAWFTPEIPLPYGPGDYVGLPGLVLKAQYGEYIIIIKKIIFLNKPPVIKKPKKGRLITREAATKKRIRQINQNMER